jgi:hypothetical protein
MCCGKGCKGITLLKGNGIVSTVDNGDGTFTITYDNGDTFTTSDLTGPQGIQGIPGTNGTDGADGDWQSIYAEAPGVSGGGAEFSDLTTVSIPELENDITGNYGDRIRIKATLLLNTPPVSAGVALYFFFVGYDTYIHPTSPSPTFGISFFRIPYTDRAIEIEIELIKGPDADIVITGKSITVDSGGDVTEQRLFTNRVTDLDLSSGDSMIIQLFDPVETSSASLEVITIDKILVP